MRITGHWHRAGSAARHPGTLTVHWPATPGGPASFAIEDEAGTSVLHGETAPSVTDRIGNIERRLSLADGTVFATRDNDAVDALLAGLRDGECHGAGNDARGDSSGELDRVAGAADHRAKGRAGRGAGWLYRLESNARWIAVSVLATVAFALAFFFIGIPVASERIAHALPQRAGEVISASTLEFLDEWLFEESQLDEERQRTIEAHVRERLLPLDTRNDGIRYRLHFRDWTMGDDPIPNALALPSGDIVLTDAFVNLTASQDEMDSVILHEIGHIVERHSLQRLVQGTFIGVTVMLVTGDGSGLADMGVGLGSLLVGSHYSRGHESAADRYAFDRMLEAGIDPIAFGDIMARMQASMTARQAGEPQAGGDDSPDDPPDDLPDDLPDGGPTMLDYLASHPRSAERIRQAQRYSDCFEQGLTTCPLD